MHHCALDNLTDRPGPLQDAATAGQLTLITAAGRPLFVAVPFDDRLLELGVPLALAVRLFEDATLSLGQGARLAGLSVPAFMDQLARLGVPIGRPEAAGIEQELADFG